MQPAAQQVFGGVAFLMVAMSLPVLLLSRNWLSGAVFLAGLALFALTHNLGSAPRN